MMISRHHTWWRQTMTPCWTTTLPWTWPTTMGPCPPGQCKYQDCQHHHLSPHCYRQTPPGSVLAIRSPLPADHLVQGSPMSERSSGDGGSDGDTGHYATVGRRVRGEVRGEAIYSSMRRPGGESDYDPYASIRIRRGQEETNYESPAV